MIRLAIRSAAIVLVLGGATLAAPALAAEGGVYSGPGVAMHGMPKYGPDFRHFDYVSPDAPKGGDVRLSAIGTFDSLNPFTLKGVPAAGLNFLNDTLTENSEDEAFSQYGLIAETIQMPDDRSWVSFTLRREARFQDHSPITPEDVIFTFDTIKKHGHPFYRAYYANVVKAEKTGERTVKFTFARGQNRELPLIIGQMPVLSRAYWEKRDFEKTTLEPPLGSGPYAIESVDPGRSITYRRVQDYWAADLPTRKGRFNFDVIRFDYYRDNTVALEAFKAGAYDFRTENASKTWATGYDFPALREGKVIKTEIPNEVPTGMQGFAYNTRRPIFSDRRVRAALAYAFDFEWSNKNLFYGAYTRTRSYFSNSELASGGLPSPAELKILEPFRDKIPDEVLTKAYEPPTTSGPGGIRGNLRTALDLLTEAGWTAQDGVLKNAKGEPFAFEILIVNPDMERIVLPFIQNLKRLGIQATVRTVDPAQYQNRVDNFDFDMIVEAIGQSLSPGNEQRDFWDSKQAGIPGSRNVMGVRDPVVDALVNLVISAPDRESLIVRTHALDRVLLWGHYVIPHWHIRSFRVAYWNKFGRPGLPPKYALGFEDWWIDPVKAAALGGPGAMQSRKP